MLSITAVGEADLGVQQQWSDKPVILPTAQHLRENFLLLASDDSCGIQVLHETVFREREI